jgi:hypothetical protein
MSQRECAGFNWPVLAVSAGEPVTGGPETSFAVPGNFRKIGRDPSAFFGP